MGFSLLCSREIEISEDPPLAAGSNPTFFGLGFFELGTCNEERKAACAGTHPSLTSAPIA